MVKGLTMRHVTTTILYPMMDAVLTDLKLNIHMCAMEALILQKINEHFEIQQQDGILIMMLSLRFEKQDEVMGRGQVQKYVITVMMWVEIVDQVTVVQLKITMCDLEGLLLQLINVSNETLDTTRMQIKITEKVHEEMDSKLLKRNVTITIHYQMMAEVQYV